MSASRRVATAALAVLVLLAGTGCVGLPRSGPVVEAGVSGDAARDDGVTFDPLPPLPDASPAEIVRGFLDAMTAVPIQTTSAAQFLTKKARSSWRPELQTITYADTAPPAGSGTVVVPVLGGGHRFDARGSYRGRLRGDQPALRFEMAVEDGDWRIDDAPDALVVPESWFEARFRQLSLYFYDPSARILVPEPVFVADDDALATRLVQGLLTGPVAGGDSRTFIPAGTRVELSVPVSEAGVADISLTDVDRPPPAALERMVVQLAWTLRQVPGIESFRVTLDGEPLRPPGSDAPFQVGLGQEYAPTGDQPSGFLFGLRRGRLVRGTLDALEPVDGPFGLADLRLRSVAVDLDAETAAGVTEDGGSVLVAPVSDAGEEVVEEVEEVLVGAVDVLEPGWDFAGRMWLVDRGSRSATVSYRQGRTLRALDVPGLSGAHVRSFLVSRDGSRLVAVVRTGGRDQLRVSRVLHDDQGDVRGATRARRIVLDAGEAQQVSHLAWLSPTTVAVLARVGGTLWEVRALSVDGAPAGVESIATLDGRVRALVGSPVTGQGLLVLSGREALDLSSPATPAVPVDRLSTLDYVG